MRYYRLSSRSLLLLAGSAALALSNAGCATSGAANGSEDSGQPGSSDSGPDATTASRGSPTAQDGAMHGSAQSDGGASGAVPGEGDAQEDGTSDSATQDGGTSDGSVDATEMETGTESGGADVGTDSGADAGDGEGEAANHFDAESDGVASQNGDASDGGREDASDGAREDASDGSIVADGRADAAPIGFSNPLSIDVSALLASSTVVTTATGGVSVTPVDGPSLPADHAFPTQAEVAALGGTYGLPNNAFFASNGTTIPKVQLAWSNTSNVNNSLVMPGNGDAGAPATFDVPADNYSQVQIYATGGNGSSMLNVTLTYATGSPLTVSSTVAVPDWCVPGALPAGEYTLASAERVKLPTAFDPTLCNIYAIDLNPDPARTLTKVALVDEGPSGDYVVFYGATAW